MTGGRRLLLMLAATGLRGLTWALSGVAAIPLVSAKRTASAAEWCDRHATALVAKTKELP